MCRNDRRSIVSSPGQSISLAELLPKRLPRAGHFRYFWIFSMKLIWLGERFLNRTGAEISFQLDKKCKKNHFLLLKKFKNAQLCAYLLPLPRPPPPSPPWPHPCPQPSGRMGGRTSTLYSAMIFWPRLALYDNAESSKFIPPYPGCRKRPSDLWFGGLTIGKKVVIV